MEEHNNQQIQQLIEDPAFRAWCFGESSAEKEQYWKCWIAKNEDQRQEVHIARLVVLEFADMKEPFSAAKKNEAWHLLSRQLSAKQSPSQMLAKRRSNFGWLYTAVAASLLIVMSLALVHYTDFMMPVDADILVSIPAQKTIATEYGEQKVISLDSGTKVTLNANSAIAYRNGWIYDDEVRLKLEGEAYFDVAKRSSEFDPVFLVETTDGDISVLGTRFMVSTRDQKTEVVLEEGQVAINIKSVGTFRDLLLEPKQRVEFARSVASVDIERVDTELYTSWRNGLFVFDHTPLPIVANRISEQFGVEVHLANPRLQDREISGSIENTDLDVVMAGLSKTLDIPIQKRGEEVVMGKPTFE
jgi:ferric-dicitrate binding protein FerR (iron transport regulator)